MSKTIKQLLKSSNKIDPLDAELLLAHTLGKPREFVLAHLDETIYNIHIIKYKILIKKRVKGIPLAYLTGHKEFFGLDFFVNKNVLIPRPDTEVLVEEAVHEIKRLSAQDGSASGVKDYEITLVDIGTGSGCIPISILKTSKHQNIKTFAIDISKQALRVAKKNAKKHGVEIKFLHGNLLSPFINLIPKPPKTYNLVITANLPYLTNKQFADEPSIHHEPKLALIAKDQGLALYEELLEQLANLSTYKLACFFEIDPDQSKPVTKLIKKHLPEAKVEIKKDLAGLDRVVIIKN